MKTLQRYIPEEHRIAFYCEKATAEFWDKHWETDQLQAIIRSSSDDGLFIPLVKKTLSPGSVVLEGGCGMGQLVHALHMQGYLAIGIDYAAKTIAKIKAAVPELDVRVGDLRSLDLPAASLDGYVSAGVIEHFWEGYQSIFQEMQRTLKPGGVLFVSFPFLSPIRKLKIALHQYPVQSRSALEADQERFYQFALDTRKVQTELEDLGFSFLEWVRYDGIKGFKDEISLSRPLLQPIYDGKRGQRWRDHIN